MIKVLFVCLGNICRSPVAEGIFNKRIQDAGLASKFQADSAGTSNYHLGDSPDPRSLSNALKNGVRLNHQARQVQIQDFALFDYILAMDRDNLNQLKFLVQRQNITHRKILLIRSFQPDADDLEVPDPYFGGEHGFQRVFDILDRCNQQLIEYLSATYR